MLVESTSTRDLDGKARARLRLEHFGSVFQFRFLLPEFSVLDNVLLPMRQLGRLRRPEMLARARGPLASLDMAVAEANPPSALSGGQRQRAAVARALAGEPMRTTPDRS